MLNDIRVDLQRLIEPDNQTTQSWRYPSRSIRYPTVLSGSLLLAIRPHLLLLAARRTADRQVRPGPSVDPGHIHERPGYSSWSISAWERFESRSSANTRLPLERVAHSCHPDREDG